MFINRLFKQKENFKEDDWIIFYTKQLFKKIVSAHVREKSTSKHWKCEQCSYPEREEGLTYERRRYDVA